VNVVIEWMDSSERPVKSLLGGLLRHEPGTREDRYSRVPWKRGVGERLPAEIETRTASARHHLNVDAPTAQARFAPGAFVGALGLLLSAPIVHHWGRMFTSEAITRGIRVRVESEYAPERSQPLKNQWFFLYTITILNESADTVQLLTRHWIITDGTGHVEEVRGPGVVGKQPTLKSGESFEYTSGCALATPFGVMEGTYQMVSEAGERFDVKIAPFTLSEPYTVH
jgi:ApaG protein